MNQTQNPLKVNNLGLVCIYRSLLSPATESLIFLSYSLLTEGFAYSLSALERGQVKLYPLSCREKKTESQDKM